MGVKRGGPGSPASSQEGPFVAKTLARPAWPFTAQAPLSPWPTTADDKAPDANYPADGEPLKWDCQSKGWPFCLKRQGLWGKFEGGSGQEMKIENTVVGFNNQRFYTKYCMFTYNLNVSTISVFLY